MRKSATEILRSLEQRVARLEKKSFGEPGSFEADLLLAQDIYKYLKKNRLKTTDLLKDTELVDLDLFLIGNRKMLPIINDWEKRNLAVSHSGSTTRTHAGFNYEEDFDVTFLTHKGAKYVYQLIRDSLV